MQEHYKEEVIVIIDEYDRPAVEILNKIVIHKNPAEISQYV